MSCVLIKLEVEILPIGYSILIMAVHSLWVEGFLRNYRELEIKFGNVSSFY